MRRVKYVKHLIVCSIVVSLTVVTPVLATPSSQELKAEQDAVKKEANALEKELNVILDEINGLKTEIDNTEKDLEQAGVDLEVAEENENDQYESMKLRIRYMYEESSNDIMIEKILEAKNITDMLNQVEYVSDVHNYDRNMLAKYVEAKELVIEKHGEFEVKLHELEEANDKVEKQQQDLSVLLTNKEAEVNALDSKIAAAIQFEIEEAERKRAEAAAAEAARKVAEEAAAAARKAAEEAAKLEAERIEAEKAEANNSTNTTDADVSSTQSDKINDAITSTTSSSNVSGQDIVNYALRFVGNKYVYGGTSLTNGIDCSGFTQAVYRAFGYNISRTSGSQRSNGTGVSYSAAKPGDIICYSGHVAIYMGNGMIVHASNSKAYPSGGIKTDSATYAPIVGVRRIL